MKALGFIETKCSETQMPSESCFCLGNAHQPFKRVSVLCRLRQKIDLANTLQ